MKGTGIRNLYPAFILAFVFCGAIVGETASLSIVVSSLGSSVLSKLYLLNGFLLFGLPVLFLKYIDRVNHGKLLSKQLIIVISLLMIFLISLLVFPEKSVLHTILLFSIYPVSYLSKTTLFLSFWTLANDLNTAGESKKTFPVIAAWGFAGGLAGAYIARCLMEIVSTEVIIVLWAFSYAIGYLFTIKTINAFKSRLVPREDILNVDSNILGKINDLLKLKLVKLISIVYFLVFILIFCIDYLFWFKCHEWFETSESLAKFQFTFYQIHAVVTMIGLWFILPGMISRFGFTRLFYGFPIVMSFGGLILMVLEVHNPYASFFTVFITVQFFRYVVFENAFSPIYQMFFAAIERERRGSAKTLLEGFVKPGAILSSGIILLMLKDHEILILGLVTACGISVTLIVFYLRRTYTRAFIPEEITSIGPNIIVAQIGNNNNLKALGILNEFSKSKDPDSRMLAVKILSATGTQDSFEKLRAMFNSEKDQNTREMISSSLSNFYNHKTRIFIEELLKDPNPRIRANAISSVNKMHCNWKRYLKSSILQLLFDNSLRVQIEAAIFLWFNCGQDERLSVTAFLKNLLGSTNSNRRSAGIYLIGIMQPEGWENLIVENLDSTSFQIFTKCTEVILKSAPMDVRIRMLSKVEMLTREHIAILGRTIEKIDKEAWETVVEFIPMAKNRRMMFELVKCLRKIADSIRSAGGKLNIRQETYAHIRRWITDELEMVYRDAYIFCGIGNPDSESKLKVLENALQENMIRICEWAVNAMVLLDKTGTLTWRYTDIDINELSQRLDLVEIIEGSFSDKTAVMLLPLLKFESFENVARVGKGYFHFTDEITEPGLIHFIRSDNRWISLCALFSIAEYFPEILNKSQVKESLVMLQRDSNRQLANTAKSLLERKGQNTEQKIDAFELLQRVLFLKETSLFRNVSAERLMRLAEISQIVTLEDNTVVSAQGEVSDHLYIVKSGCLRVLKTDGSHAAEISKVKSGETYGELGLFTQSPRSATAVTEGKCELYVLKRGSLKKLLFEVPEIAFNLLEVLSERLKKSGEKMVEISREISNDELEAAQSFKA
jgi:hypothetical protein